MCVTVPLQVELALILRKKKLTKKYRKKGPGRPSPMGGMEVVTKIRDLSVGGGAGR